MGNELGQAIKINRLRANMTQAELASGIISVSYLSKIENGSAEPANDIMELLGEKLKLKMIDSDNHITNQTIIKWFLYLLHSNVDESIELYNQINHNVSNAIDKQLLSLIEIHKLCYFILINNLEEAEKLLFSLQKSSKRFNDIEKYYYLKFVGSYHYTLLSYKKSQEYYQEAEKYIKSNLFHQAEETNNLYYLIALAASKNRQPHLSLLYSNKALKYYRTNYELKECAECHILLGISYQRINDLVNSKASYSYAISIAKKIQDLELLKLCYQNMGSLYSDWNQHTEAIINFHESYELRKEDSDDKKLVPVLSLMKEYYELNDIESSKIWLELGLDLIKSMNPLESLYVFKFTAYKYLINGLDISFENLVVGEIIPFLEEKELFYEKVFYIKLLAKYFKTNRKYKLSTYYYEEAFNLLAKITYT